MSVIDRREGGGTVA